MDILTLKENLIQGDRRAIAQAMTLVESTRPDHQEQAQALLQMILHLTGTSFRLGISGAPGAGKSTFIENFGERLIKNGHKLAVLAIDPSSPLSKGSILADKTRMVTLSHHPSAFIRPSPSGGALGGTSQRTADVIMIAEAAGFDMILIETVGVGQSEIDVFHLSDMVMLLVGPASGDALQGMKKGIVEIADLIIINKSDGSLKDRCQETAQAYRGALEMTRSRLGTWAPKVRVISALNGEGLDPLQEDMTAFQKATQDSGDWKKRRQAQALYWLEQETKSLLWQAVTQHTATLSAAERRIEAQETTSFQEAQQLMQVLLKT